MKQPPSHFLQFRSGINELGRSCLTVRRSLLNNRSSLLPSLEYLTTSSILLILPVLPSISPGLPSRIKHDSRYLLSGGEKLSLAWTTEAQMLLIDSEGCALFQRERD
jgi:hypothetical protein